MTKKFLTFINQNDENETFKSSAFGYHYSFCKTSFLNWWFLFYIRKLLYFSALVLTCYRLKKGHATFYRPETIVASLLLLMCYLLKWFLTISTALQIKPWKFYKKNFHFKKVMLKSKFFGVFDSLKEWIENVFHRVNALFYTLS